MPGNVDEKKWNEAKQAARKSYPGISEDGDKFWKIVQGIYDNMGGKRMGEPYASDNSKFDSHVVDPAKLKAEVKKDLGVKDDPNKINNPRPDADPIMGIQSARDKYMKQ